MWWAGNCFANRAYPLFFATLLRTASRDTGLKMEFTNFLPQLPRIAIIAKGSILGNTDTVQLREMINMMGAASAIAQNLRKPITTFAKLVIALFLTIKMDNPNHRIYLLSISSSSIGFLRIGNKQLYANGEAGGHLQISPLCVLDFYVSESYQRNGFGKEIFEFMLDNEKNILAGAHKLAYDRPSTKLQWFLRKHYGLTHYIPQANNFLIFREFGLSSPPGHGKSAYGTMSRRNAGMRLEPIKPYTLAPLAPLFSGPNLDVSIEGEIQDVPSAVERYSTIPAIGSKNPSDAIIHCSESEPTSQDDQEISIAPSTSNRIIHDIDIESRQASTRVPHDSMVNIIQNASTTYPQYKRNKSLPALPSRIDEKQAPINPFEASESQYRQFADFRRKNHNKLVIERRTSFQSQHESSLFQNRDVKERIALLNWTRY
jgi:GNAT superfamily N-acetyltransferase